MRPPRRLAAGLCIAASLLCAAPVFCQPRATTTGPDGLRIPHARPEPSSDEAGLWDATARAERSAKASGEVNADLALNAYVRHLICKLAPEYGDDLRALVMNRPFLNASAAPNGYVEVYTGLLLRTENEDQLAFVLGHEITHFARNHSLKAWRHTRNAMNGALLLSTGVALAAGAASHSAAGNGGAGAARTVNTISSTARDLNNLVYLNAIASIFAFDRDDESEADRLGYARAMRAGYRGAAAIDMWNEVLDEARASEFEAVRHGDSGASIFDTHPLTTERISALIKLGPVDPAGDPEAAVRYRAIIRPYLATWLRDDLRRRDYSQTLFLIRRLEREGEDVGLLAYFRGEALRLRRGEEDLQGAIASYQAATRHPDAPVAVWRELGDASRRAGDTAGAVAALSRYVDLAPNAQDRWLVETTLKTLKQGLGT